MSFKYLAFYKPFQVLTQFSSPEGESRRETLADYIRVPKVYPTGRLDYDSEGLLLLSDDGPLQHRLTDPRFAHPRTYWAQVEGIITDAALKQLRAGVMVQDYRTRPCQAQRLEPAPDVPPRTPAIRFRREIPSAWMGLTLTEGRNRQVRRMTAAVGLPTLRLIRAAIGTIDLEGLRPGEWRWLEPDEVNSLKRAVGS